MQGQVQFTLHQLRLADGCTAASSPLALAQLTVSCWPVVIDAVMKCMLASARA